MTAHVLGLGPTLKYFLERKEEFSLDYIVGVNDIWQYYPAQRVVCVDRPVIHKSRFTPERLKTIAEGLQINFYTPYPSSTDKQDRVQRVGWEGKANEVSVIKLSSAGRGVLKHQDDRSVYPYSNNST